MSERISVTPILDGIRLGAPISEHFGIRTYPAIGQDLSQKYIVKVVSIPASQSKLEALLITGAYQDAAEAAEYFRSQAEQSSQEAAILEKLSQQQGFLPFSSCQLEPMGNNRIGYELYLLAPFRLSLSRYMSRRPITHLDAIHMGIDICGALSAARAEGFLYVDLKPANVFITEAKAYQIGDLGFVPLDSLSFTSMPEKYRSAYSAPEFNDDLITLNTYADTYALGRILYQVFNLGNLPEHSVQPLPVPVAADADLAGILLKACSPNCEDRWASPEQLCEALRTYLNTHTVDDTPILEPLPGQAMDQTMRLFQIPDDMTVQESSETSSADTHTAADGEETKDNLPENTEAQKPVLPDEPATEAVSIEFDSGEELSPQPPVQTTVTVTVSDAEPADQEPSSEEVSDSADALSQDVAVELEAAVAAEFATLRSPIPEVPQIEPQALDSDLKAVHEILKTEHVKPKRVKKEPNVTPVVIKPKKKHKFVRFLVTVLMILALAAAGLWGYVYYNNEYLQKIDALSVSGTMNEMVVTVHSSLPDGVISVVCTDPYGHSSKQTVRGGQAVFTNLSPDSLYKVTLETSGFHKLTGPTSEMFATESVTNVASFTAAMGSEEGSVLLNLVVEGHDSEQWQVIYTADGEPELGHTFNGHSTTVDNLKVGKEYTFRLQTGNHEQVSGMNTVVFTPTQIIKPKNLCVLSCNNGVLTVSWEANVDSDATWHVHCSGSGYEQTISTKDLTASFPEIDSNASYSVDVVAEGMSQTAQVSVSANPITLKDFHVTENDSQTMTVTWDYDGAVPAGGWILQYTIDSSYLPTAVKCMEPTAVVESRIPDAVYHFTVMTADDISVFNGIHTYESSRTANYSGHTMLANSISCDMLLVTPESPDWTRESLSGNPATSSFKLGDRISAVLHSSSNFYLGAVGEDILDVMFVFRDENGDVLTELIGEESLDWYSLWFAGDYHYCELNVPTTPIRAGTYSLTIYFNGLVAASAKLTVHE